MPLKWSLRSVTCFWCPPPVTASPGSPTFLLALQLLKGCFAKVQRGQHCLVKGHHRHVAAHAWRACDEMFVVHILLYIQNYTR